MLYLSGIYALNLVSEDGTPGDWHFCALDWENPRLRETADYPYGLWGIEKPTELPNGRVLPKANHVRACLDLVAEGKFSTAGGMREYYIADDSWNERVFSEVAKLKEHPNWDDIDRFMSKEYMLDWLRYKNRMTVA